MSVFLAVTPLFKIYICIDVYIITSDVKQNHLTISVIWKLILMSKPVYIAFPHYSAAFLKRVP